MDKLILIKSLKQTNGNHRITFTKKEINKLKIQDGDYLVIKKFTDPTQNTPYSNSEPSD